MNEKPKSIVNGHAYEHVAVLSLGANVGSRLENLQAALDSLEDTPGLVVTGISAVYETEPFGGAPGAAGSADLSAQPDFLNAVVGIATELAPHTLLLRTQAIEAALHRTRETHWSPRTIDVDIIIYDDLVLDDEQLTIPHPRAHERAFVLMPWHDIDPAAAIPGLGAVAELLDAALATGGVVRRDDMVLQV